MDMDAEYRRQAEECEKQVELARSELERTAWQRLATGFRNLLPKEKIEEKP
jgi:hypothetical protein